MRVHSFPAFLGVAALALLAAFFATTAASARAAQGQAFTCTGGSIPAGSYSSLTISGFCTLDAGSVNAQRVNVTDGGVFVAAFGGSDLTVGQNLRVSANGALVLGCEPEEFTCFNDPDQSGGTLLTHDVIGGNLIADGALAVLVHADQILGNAIVSGGGGGVNCDSQDALMGSPAYLTIEDSTIGGNAVVTNFHSCWLGFIRNDVSGNVNFHGNVTFDPDGNEIVTNTISGNLNCTGNSPAPQVGDSEGEPNVVGRRANGQCAGLVAP